MSAWVAAKIAPAQEGLKELSLIKLFRSYVEEEGKEGDGG